MTKKYRLANIIFMGLYVSLPVVFVKADNATLIVKGPYQY